MIRRLVIIAIGGKIGNPLLATLMPSNLELEWIEELHPSCKAGTPRPRIPSRGESQESKRGKSGMIWVRERLTERRGPDHTRTPARYPLPLERGGWGGSK